MTDTGQVPGEGQPENAGGHPGQPQPASVPFPADAGPMEQQGCVPAPDAYPYLDPADGAAEDDDLLLMPGAQGAWSEQQAQQPLPQPHETHQQAPAQPPQQGVPGQGVPFAAPGAGFAPVPAQGGDHESGGRDSGSVDLSAVRIPQPAAPPQQERPQNAPEAPAPPEPTRPTAPEALAQPDPTRPTVPTRRPLHMGPPVPDPTGGVVRSLADRGPAGTPPQNAARHAGPQVTGPEYFDTPAESPAPAPAEQPAAAPPAEPQTAPGRQPHAEQNFADVAYAEQPSAAPSYGEQPYGGQVYAEQSYGAAGQGPLPGPQLGEIPSQVPPWGEASAQAVAAPVAEAADPAAVAPPAEAGAVAAREAAPEGGGEAAPADRPVASDQSAAVGRPDVSAEPVSSERPPASDNAVAPAGSQPSAAGPVSSSAAPGVALPVEQPQPMPAQGAPDAGAVAADAVQEGQRSAAPVEARPQHPQDVVPDAATAGQDVQPAPEAAHEAAPDGAVPAQQPEAAAAAAQQPVEQSQAVEAEAAGRPAADRAALPQTAQAQAPAEAQAQPAVADQAPQAVGEAAPSAEPTQPAQAEAMPGRPVEAVEGQRHPAARGGAPSVPVTVPAATAIPMHAAAPQGPVAMPQAEAGAPEAQAVVEQPEALLQEAGQPKPGAPVDPAVQQTGEVPAPEATAQGPVAPGEQQPVPSSGNVGEANHPAGPTDAVPEAPQGAAPGAAEPTAAPQPVPAPAANAEQPRADAPSPQPPSVGPDGGQAAEGEQPQAGPPADGAPAEAAPHQEGAELVQLGEGHEDEGRGDEIHEADGQSAEGQETAGQEHHQPQATDQHGPEHAPRQDGADASETAAPSDVAGTPVAAAHQDQDQDGPAADNPPDADGAPAQPPAAGYDDSERAAVHRVIRERRDIRNGFRADPIPNDVLLRVLEAAHTAPSVGHSQPWDFVVIRSAETREKMHQLAMQQREAYAKSLPKARAKQFRELKIEAILETPVNIVVTADSTRGGRHTLGRHTQPQMAPYSSALAVENLWLAARAEGLGVGWVSFFDEREMVRELGLPEHLEVVAYLCLGYVDEFPDEPELLQAGWSKRRPLSWVVHEETYGRRALPGEDPHDLLQETLHGIRPLDAKALGEAWERQKRMTKPAGALGMLEIISAQLSGLSRKCPPPIPEPAAVAIFAGDHGVHAQGVTPWPQEVTGQMVANFLGGGAVCNAFANQVGAEVCVVDVGVAGDLPATPGLLPRKIRPGTDDFTAGPAMTQEDVLKAVEVGIETARDLVAAGNKVLLTGEMGIANTTTSAALIAVYTGADPTEVTGRGTGINDETHARKVDVVRRALELHQPDPADPVGVLAAVGGLEHAALVGLILGGASLRTPVILDGVSPGAAALVARAIAPEALAACIAGHRSAEPGHVAALTKLGLRPLVDLDLRLGEGTGALLALPVVQSAARAMHEVATFDSAGVTEKS
ncbi:nicotinate-nucleotide--dimethylbenzimidazole phosphoribosyltransferase [Streptomyces halobius]|uniref:Nicotinate-nucleotide--dimethylbenzimidazole phosphoribosyltransferase n=1 Tax=Streptomyces halobius TaxID=2879846 RepID=A0ABY4MJ73_9ACTN|nr:nicotinate-nucleotide--dimethylbenzimidazole phosphoribosyltransferase [Streptomyces halobius]UQA96460.1 nicotinate-nucleotide--dimethylbenzimidazole phosphoribosyltransferase [Streptomyces halobius]